MYTYMRSISLCTNFNIRWPIWELNYDSFNYQVKWYITTFIRRFVTKIKFEILAIVVIIIIIDTAIII
jgi:hypothetical protein